MATVLDRRYQAHLAELRRRVALGVTRAWHALPSYDDDDVATFIDRAVPIVGAAQTNAVRTTEAFLSRVSRSPIVGLGAAALIGAGVRNGASPEDVYRRPFVTVWTALSKGVDYQTAVASGLARAAATAQTDVALSTRAAAVAFAEQTPRIVGWERVADDGACELCQIASEQRYHSADLMPIHDRCGCTVEPIIDESAVATTAAPDGLAIHEHGELGPVLARAGDTFTGPDDLEA